MALVRSKDTKPELRLRSILGDMGVRFQSHAKLPGKPDVVLEGSRKVIFVHGCFWHRHPRCKNARVPKSRLDFWLPKLTANRKRDFAIHRELRKMEYEILVAWECQLAKPNRLKSRLRRFTEAP
jgi:DNA mismatch endonuclease, patch repair protein